MSAFDETRAAALEALLAKATPGPWEARPAEQPWFDSHVYSGSRHVCNVDALCEGDVALIASLRNEAPDLLAAWRAQQALAEKLLSCPTTDDAALVRVYAWAVESDRRNVPPERLRLSGLHAVRNWAAGRAEAERDAAVQRANAAAHDMTEARETARAQYEAMVEAQRERNAAMARAERAEAVLSDLAQAAGALLAEHDELEPDVPVPSYLFRTLGKVHEAARAVVGDDALPAIRTAKTLPPAPDVTALEQALRALPKPQGRADWQERVLKGIEEGKGGG